MKIPKILQVRPTRRTVGRLIGIGLLALMGGCLVARTYSWLLGPMKLQAREDCIGQSATPTSLETCLNNSQRHAGFEPLWIVVPLAVALIIGLIWLTVRTSPRYDDYRSFLDNEPRFEKQVRVMGILLLCLTVYTGGSALAAAGQLFAGLVTIPPP